MTEPSASGAARGREFERFVLELMRRSPDIEIADIPVTPYDIQAWRDDRLLHVALRLTTPQTAARLENFAKQLNAWMELELFPSEQGNHVLAVPGLLPRSKMTAPLRKRLEIWDGPYLYYWATRLDVAIPPFIISGEPYVHEADVGQAEHELSGRLATIERGEKGWHAYEDYCQEVLNFLFVPPLNTAISQSHDERKINRRDFVLPNYATEGFWHFLRQHYAADYVVAEVKNLRNRPGKGEVVQVGNYLNRHGTGLFALILARGVLNENGRWVRREQWLEHDKLIVDIDDSDVLQMIRMKVAGDEPAELIRQKIEDFRLRI